MPCSPASQSFGPCAMRWVSRVSAVPAEQHEQLINAALAVADAEAAARVEARIVPLRRPQPLFLAVAAAVLVLAAVASAGLISSRGGDNADTAAPAMADASPDIAEEAMAEAVMGSDDAEMAAADEAMAEAEPMAEEAPMAGGESMAAEEPMAEEAPMAGGESMADEAMEAAAEPVEMEASAVTTTVVATEADGDQDQVPPTSADIDEAHATDSTTGDDPTGQVVDLGTLENLESLFENIGARRSAALDDDAMADPGVCAATVHQQALELGTDTVQPLVVTVGIEDPATFDVRFARRSDGTAIIVYASPPDCEIGVHELPGS